MAFLSALAITAFYWALLFVFFFSILMIVKRQWRTHQKATKKIAIYSVIFATFCTTLFENATVSAYIAVAIIAVPMMLVLFLQICFWVTSYLRFGTIFEEATKPYVKVVREEVIKRERKWCPICKKHSGCRVRRANNGMLVHVFL